jgi:ribulose-5-phosphate 4-epimerase/fuculose-1-phosphate aldolase
LASIEDNEGNGDMTVLTDSMRDLAIANRILAHEGVVDGFGHISMRHPERPDRFLLARSRSPALVTPEDVMEFDLDCNPIDQRGRVMYAERPIHGAVYKARPDVQSVAHNHAQEVLPFTVTKVKLRPMVHVAGDLGSDIPVWDIRTKFGTTDLLVRNMEQGGDLAACLGQNRVALMRGHGATVATDSLKRTVYNAVYLMVNAKLQAQAMGFGDITFLSEGECEGLSKTLMSAVSLDRVWEYWGQRCGASA